jgi:hypothetical protein
LDEAETESFPEISAEAMVALEEVTVAWEEVVPRQGVHGSSALAGERAAGRA